jgi:hypothetical protein
VKKILVTIIGVVLCLSAYAQEDTATPTATATSTHTPTPTRTPGVDFVSRREGNLYEVSVEWAANATGNAEATTGGYYTGELLRAVFINVDSSTSPYNVKLYDKNNVDLFDGLVATVPDDATTITQAGPIDAATKIYSVILDSQLKFSVDGAKADHRGESILYIKK